MKASKFTLSSVALVLLSVSAWASNKMRANIQIYETVHLGSTQLDPGEYKMTWTESGSNAEVTFSQGKKVIATVPAHVTQGRSGYHSPAIHTDSSTSTLIGVELLKYRFPSPASMLPQPAQLIDYTAERRSSALCAHLLGR